MKKMFSGGKARFQGAAVLFCALYLLLAGICPAQTNITEVNIPNNLTVRPTGIAYGADGAYWFLEESPGKIGRIDTISNVITEIYLTNNSGAQPYGITRGPDNGLWFTESGANVIGRLNPFATNYGEYLLPSPTNAEPTAIITGPDSNIWFVEYALSRIAAISPTPTLNTNGTLNLLYESPAIRSPSLIFSLTVGPDNNIWFTEGNGGLIGRLSVATKQITEFALPNANCKPFTIVTGADGALWFTEFNTGKIGRITTNGIVLEYALPNSPSATLQPYGLIAGQDGRLWFTEYNGSVVGSITTNGVIAIFPTPTPDSAPAFLATGTGDTNIWFTEDYGYNFGNQKIGRLAVSNALNMSAPVSTFLSPTPQVTPNVIILNMPPPALATFQNANLTNTVTANWGDGVTDTLTITNLAVNAQVRSGGLTVFNNSGTYIIANSHVYPAVSNYLITLTVTDSGNNMAVANITLPPDTFFLGELAMANQVEFLQFANGTLFGYFTLAYFPYLYHFDMGFEYFFPANDGQNSVYLYDFTSGHFFYTSPAQFPYLYDFTLNSWLYYYPDTTRPGHYTSNPRYFYNFGTGTIITQ